MLNDHTPDVAFADQYLQATFKRSTTASPSLLSRVGDKRHDRWDTRDSIGGRKQRDNQDERENHCMTGHRHHYRRGRPVVKRMTGCT
jgi:hypothetical protein